MTAPLPPAAWNTVVEDTQGGHSRKLHTQAQGSCVPGGGTEPHPAGWLHRDSPLLDLRHSPRLKHEGKRTEHRAYEGGPARRCPFTLISILGGVQHPPLPPAGTCAQWGQGPTQLCAKGSCLRQGWPPTLGHAA